MDLPTAVLPLELVEILKLDTMTDRSWHIT